MRYSFYAIAFLTIMLVITFHASLVMHSPLSLFSGSITLDITYHVSLLRTMTAVMALMIFSFLLCNCNEENDVQNNFELFFMSNVGV